jgi:peptidoglycan/LPS O-acetylase OafA/YrhL
MKKDRILGFDIARAVSIIWVVLYHSIDYANAGQLYNHSAVKTITYASLAIFTFLSGYLLASRYQFDKKGSVREFYKKRFIRFYPLFFVSSIILCLIGFNTWINTAKGLVGLSPFWTPHPRTMWYCAMLISLYLLTPLWSKGNFWVKVFKFAGTMAVIAIVHVMFHSVEPRTFFYFPFFFLGILVSQYGNSFFLTASKSPKYTFLLLILFVAIWIVQAMTNNSMLKWGNSILGMVSLLFLYMYIGEKMKNNKNFLWMISLLSYASLSIYLFHREVDEALLWLWQPSNPYIMFLYVGIVGLLITIVLAYWIQKGYDRILQNKQK